MTDKNDLFITAKTIEIWKKQASRLARKKGFQRAKGLDVLAKRLGFSDWQEIQHHHKRIQDREAYVSQGTIVVFDDKQCPEDDLGEIGYQEQWSTSVSEDIDALLYPYLAWDYGLTEKGLNEVLLNKWSSEDACDFGDYLYFKCFFNPAEESETLEDVLMKFEPFAFFPALYVWHKGVFHDLKRSEVINLGDRTIVNQEIDGEFVRVVTSK